MDEAELEEFLGLSGRVEGEARRAAEAVIPELERVGFFSHERARSFLNEYCGLKIFHPPAAVILEKHVSSFTRFDPSLVCTACDADVARRCSVVVGVGLFPVGVDSFHLTVYSGDDGRFYAGMDSSVFAYGDDADAMFSMMRDGIRPALLGDWPFEPGDVRGRSVG